MDLRDYTFLGTTHSLCPACRRLVDAKIIVRRGRVYFRKRCPEHGLIEDLVCSDVAYYDRHEFSQPARLPQAFGTRSDKGCPYDCGLCPEHEQHTCIALVEITSNCNRLAHDAALVEQLAQMRDRLEIYLQFDGLEQNTHAALRGEELLETKL